MSEREWQEKLFRGSLKMRHLFIHVAAKVIHLCVSGQRKHLPLSSDLTSESTTAPQRALSKAKILNRNLKGTRKHTIVGGGGAVNGTKLGFPPCSAWDSGMWPESCNTKITTDNSVANQHAAPDRSEGKRITRKSPVPQPQTNRLLFQGASRMTDSTQETLLYT